MKKINGTASVRSVIFRIAPVLCLALLLSLGTGGMRPVRAASVRETLPILQMKELARISPPEGGSYLEGGTSASSGYLAAFLSSTGSSPNPVLLLDMKTWAVVKTAYVQLAHANDMCYIPQRREIYVVPMESTQVIVLDEATLTVKRTIATSVNYHAIGYDTKSDRFAAVYVSGEGAGRHLNCDILDGTCTKVLGSFSTDTNLTYQGLAVNDSLIYYSCWERGAVNSLYEPVYDGVFQPQDNVIYVYDFSGKLVKTLLVTMPEGFVKFEVESVAFSGKRMILQFNETLNDEGKTRLIGFYEAAGEGPSIAQQAAEKKAAEEKAAALKEEAENAAQFAKLKTSFTSLAGKRKLVKAGWNPLNFGTKAVSGYEAQICRKRSFTGDSLRTVRSAANLRTFAHLNRKTVYYVRVRAYYRAGTKTYYSAWSGKKKIRTR